MKIDFQVRQKAPGKRLRSFNVMISTQQFRFFPFNALSEVDR